jgi:cyclopropane-fatty-acyl-phospholipid synthase
MPTHGEISVTEDAARADRQEAPRGSGARSRLYRVVKSRLDVTAPHASFAVIDPTGDVQQFGPGNPTFEVHCRNRQGWRAVTSLDELRFCEAYMRGDVDVDGSMYDLLRLRAVMRDVRPLQRLGALLNRHLRNTGRSREKWIGHHYDEPVELFASFLDPEHLCYSHGFFLDERESLEHAMTRKLEYAIHATNLRPGMRVLDIGGGWGSFLRYAGRQGIHVTSLTISPKQHAWMTKVIADEALPCRVLMQDVYAYRVPETERFDAIVNLGVTEHLTNYKRLTSQYRHLLKPGGKIYFDSCASHRMYDVGSFIARHIFPGTTSYLCVDRFLAAAAQHEFEIELIQNDRTNYSLTTKRWGERLETNRDYIVRHVGDATFRKFRLLIWACAAMFDLKVVTAYRVVLRG